MVFAQGKDRLISLRTEKWNADDADKADLNEFFVRLGLFDYGFIAFGNWILFSKKP